MNDTLRQTRPTGSGGAAETSQVTTRGALQRSLASLPLAEQQRAVQPGMPVQFTGGPLLTSGAAPVTCDRQAQWVQFEGKPGASDLVDPMAHPEWPKFKAGSQKLVPPMNEKEAAKLWTLIIEGIRDGKPENYDYVADQLFGRYMQVGKGEMALWSGGIGMSNYAVSLGFKTLESRQFYNLTDGLALYDDWDKVRPVWVAFSRKFVEQCQGVVHCFLRYYSETSVFGEVEHNILLGKGGQVKIRYHACFGPDDDVRELDKSGEVQARGQQILLRSLGDTAEALKNAQKRYPDGKLPEETPKGRRG
jgi:hypothetical protein